MKTLRQMSGLERETEVSLRVLAEGGLLVYPTDTVWGVGCDACNAEAVERLYALKGRDRSKSMLVLALWDAAEYWRKQSLGDRALLSDGRPTTYIVEASLLPWRLAPNLMAADGTIGVRCPQHDFCRRLLVALERPIVSTSANLSGQPTPLHYGDIDANILARADYCVEPMAGMEGCGQSSRIVRLAPGGVTVIRP